ncbi:hypothetical protein E8E95_06405 [Pseudomonas sp. BN414]|uniref:hypothetical protein n=1 Tax=Pseudomonas sp. BN414 TaxID=2567888 RepID=UPI002455AB8C|nr:hypothetical protein [Pseudomonas sp. BN414]MDH4566306.1 hypothetical protein [Pseudomonas sp. BN414]
MYEVISDSLQKKLCEVLSDCLISCSIGSNGELAVIAKPFGRNDGLVITGFSANDLITNKALDQAVWRIYWEVREGLRELRGATTEEEITMVAPDVQDDAHVNGPECPQSWMHVLPERSNKNPFGVRLLPTSSISADPQGKRTIFPLSNSTAVPRSGRTAVAPGDRRGVSSILRPLGSTPSSDRTVTHPAQ